jgi:hypothetical protein
MALPDARPNAPARARAGPPAPTGAKATAHACGLRGRPPRPAARAPRAPARPLVRKRGWGREGAVGL